LDSVLNFNLSLRNSWQVQFLKTAGGGATIRLYVSVVDLTFLQLTFVWLCNMSAA